MLECSFTGNWYNLEKMGEGDPESPIPSSSST